MSNLSKTATLEMVLEDRQRLEAHVWTDQEIRKIPTEALARHAYQSSVSLPKQYLTEALFCSHWEGLRRQHRLSEGEMEAPLDSKVRADWDGNPKLRAEFGSFETYCAFLKADRAGVARIAGRQGDRQ